PRPLRLRRARGDHGVARVLPRGSGDVLPLGLVGPPRLRARKRAADEELVGLLDGQPGHLTCRIRRTPVSDVTGPPARGWRQTSRRPRGGSPVRWIATRGSWRYGSAMKTSPRSPPSTTNPADS